MAARAWPPPPGQGFLRLGRASGFAVAGSRPKACRFALSFLAFSIIRLYPSTPLAPTRP
jgi:hypothetical protein